MINKSDIQSYEKELVNNRFNGNYSRVRLCTKQHQEKS